MEIDYMPHESNKKSIRTNCPMTCSLKLILSSQYEYKSPFLKNIKSIG